MKKYLLLALIALVAAACSKEETKSTFDYPMEALYGTWRVTHIEQKDGTMLNVTTWIAEKVFKPTYATFRRDGTYTGQGAFGDGKGKYKVYGKTITCYIDDDDDEYVRYDVLYLNDDQAELSMYNSERPSSTLRIRCKKQ